MRAGVENLYYSFLESLEEKKEDVAPLQLSGKIEKYLEGLLILHVYRQSQGKCFALQNLGLKGKQRVDVSVITGPHPMPDKGAYIQSFFEIKYFRNRHRIWEEKANDEILTSLKELKSQLHPFNKLDHGYYDVNLISKNNQIYGLVFCSYVSQNPDLKEQKEFLKEIKEKASLIGFGYHDLPNPRLDKVYENIKVKILNTDFYVSLHSGLWIKK